jgi:hypothetical protein
MKKQNANTKRDYGRTQEMGKTYYDFINTITDKAMLDVNAFKHSEFKDPSAKNYEAMDTSYDLPDDPWYMPPNPWQIPGMGTHLGEAPLTCEDLFYIIFRPIWASPPKYSSSQVYGAIDWYLSMGCPMVFIQRCREYVATISAVTNNMEVGTSQTLTAISIFGDDPYANVYLSWSVSGGGTLSEEFGKTTVYTAPASLDCTAAGSNPVISLYCGSFLQSSLKMGIYKTAGGDVLAWKQYRKTTLANACCHNGPVIYAPLWNMVLDSFRCDDTLHDTGVPGVCLNHPQYCVYVNCSTSAGVCDWTVTDLRTGAMKADSCCPLSLA